MSDTLPKILTTPVLPLRETVVFPQMSIPLSVGREASVNAVVHAEQKDVPIGSLLTILTQKDGNLEIPKPEDLYETGTLVEILKKSKKSDGSYTLLVKGVKRVRVKAFTQFTPFLEAQVDVLEDEVPQGVDLNPLFLSVRAAAHEIINAAPNVPSAASRILDSITDPGYLADICTTYLDLDIKKKIDILHETNVLERLKKTLSLLDQALGMMKLSDKIRSNVKEEMSKTQREYYLREQLKAIRKELGDDEGSDADELETQVESAGMPEDVLKVAKKEMKRLKSTNSNSAEAGVIRNYIEWLTEVPWTKTTEDNLDLTHAEKILDEDHYGLEKVKRHILEYLAVAKLRKKPSGQILCLVGPPGVGKTSLGKSIARALNRQFLRISLGGVRDEAEIRGHRRTYIGAMPGKIINGMKKVKTMNPVFVLDEIDKLGNDWRGDPSSALLEVLDPEQNNTFVDHYLDVPYDLSKVFFICTANVTDTIPAALRDRLEMIDLRGYTEMEKMQIAKRYLIPQAKKATGMETEEHSIDVKIPEETVLEVIRSYTRESGVRHLKREVENLMRSIAHKAAKESITSVEISKEEVNKILGSPKHLQEVAQLKSRPGVVTGLAWTPVGGDILFIESAKMSGKGNLKITGQLGDVMKESAQAALSYLRAHSTALKLDSALFDHTDIHLHVPAGAIPKDGPSAGSSIIVSLASLLVGKPVDHLTAMTGEITLRGSILPVGGIKEKVLAAHRAGIKRIILPAINKKDLDDIPKDVQKDVEITFVETIAELIQQTLKMDVSADEFEQLAQIIIPQNPDGSKGSGRPVH